MSKGASLLAVSTTKSLESKKSEIYTFVNKKKSTYQKQAVAGEKNPTTGIFKDSTKFTYLPLESTVNLGDEGTVSTMYIQNAPTHFMDDLYVDQEGHYHTTMSASEEEAKANGWSLKKGLISLKYTDTEAKIKSHRARGKRLKIGFEEGIMVLDKYGNDKNLKRFIECHHQNVKSPNFRSPAFTLFLFSSLEEEKIAESQIGPIEVEAQVMQYITSLRTSKGKMFSYTEANKAKVNATLMLLDMKNFQEENYAQKHQAINVFAKSNPAYFMEIVEDAFDEKRMAIAMGLNDSIKTIYYDKKDKIFFLNTGTNDKGPTKRELVRAESADYDAQVEELIIHLINNSVDWRDLTLLTEAAKSK